MSSPASSLSPPKSILLASHFASTQDLTRLRQLISLHSNILAGETLLRLLLCLPETAPIDLYKPYIDLVVSKTPLPPEETPPVIDTTTVASLTEKQARRKVEQILPSLLNAPAEGVSQERDGLVVAFITARAFQIDRTTGNLSIACDLLNAYAPALSAIETLRSGSAAVLYRLVYELMREPVPSLGVFANLPVKDALEVMILDPATVVTDLEKLVVPYMAVRDLKEWHIVWTKIGALPFANVVEVMGRWTPPEDVRVDFANWAMGVCYKCEDTSPKAWDGMHSVHRRITALRLGLPDETLPDKIGDLNDNSNGLFRPSPAGINQLDVLITSSAILLRPLKEVTRLKLEGTKELQTAVLRQFVRSGIDWTKRNNEEWIQTREGARWLRNKSGVLAQLSTEEVERMILAGMLAGSRFGLAKDTYVAKNGGLSLENVEKCVLEAFSEFFDNASNGNRTRGHLKSAYQCITLLYPQTCRSPALERSYRLISAVHALSAYSLTPTPGVPLLPVRIRVHSDPISLLTTLLAQNRRSYLQPDVLVSIANDLALGTGQSISPAATEARVLAYAAEAALAEDDFETAYAYVTTRLLPSADPPCTTERPVSPVIRHRLHHQPDTPPPGDSADMDAAKDTLWRTALTAGRYRSPYAAISNAPPRGPVALRLLEKKMELLALAVRFAPKEALPDVLEKWRSAEEEVEVVVEAEERAGREHAALAGGGGREVRRARDEEAPQSLFEVARGAARVFGGTGGGVAKALSGIGGGAPEESARPLSTDGGERIRRRDVVGGMVTQGLASGLGWVLGAQPVTDQERR